MPHRGVPFLILAMTKIDYRVIKMLKKHPDPQIRSLAHCLRIYTPGDDLVSPFRLNLLARLPGISTDEHLAYVLYMLEGAEPMEGPLRALLRLSLHRLYEQFPDPNAPPVLCDLLETAEKVMETMGYTGDARENLRTALKVRVGDLTLGACGKVFQCRQHVPDIGVLAQSSSLIEMDRLEPSEACVLTLAILTLILEYLKTTPAPPGRLRLVIIIDEAHVLVGRTAEAGPSETNANPKGHTTELVIRMGLVIRALGGSLVIADQHPSVIAPEVIKTSVTKVAFCQVAEEDRRELAGAMLLSELEAEELARLTPGQAFFITEGYHRPRRIQALDPLADVDVGPLPIGVSLLPYIQDEDWYLQDARNRLDAESDQLLQQMDRFETRRVKLLRKAAGLSAAHPRILAKSSTAARAAGLTRLIRNARSLRQQLTDEYVLFARRYFRPLFGAGQAGTAVLPHHLRAQLARRFKFGIVASTRKCVARLESNLKRYEADLEALEGE